MGVNTIHAQYQRIIVQICLVSSVDWASQAFLWGGGGTFLSCTWYLPTVLLKRFAWKKYLVCANQPAGAQNSFPSFLSSVAFPVWGAVTGKHLIPPGNCCYKTPWQDVNVTEKTFPDWNDSFWCGFREGIEDFAGFFFQGFGVLSFPKIASFWEMARHCDFSQVWSLLSFPRRYGLSCGDSK